MQFKQYRPTTSEQQIQKWGKLSLGAKRGNFFSYYVQNGRINCALRISE